MAPSSTTTSPFDALPVELLLQIFSAAVPKFNYPIPRNETTPIDKIVRVCGHWREVGMEARTLWTFICIQPKNICDDQARRRQARHVQQYVDMSKDLPLSVHIRSYAGERSAIDTAFDWLGASATARIHNLSVASDGRMREGLACHIAGTHMSKLRVLRISDVRYTPWTSMKLLYLEELDVQMADMPPPQTFEWMISALGLCFKLQSIRISVVETRQLPGRLGHYQQWLDQDPHRRLVFPKLSTLSFIHFLPPLVVKFFNQVEAPNLENMELIGVPSKELGRGWSRITSSFPKVHKLTLAGWRDPDHLLARLTKLSPNVIDLDFRVTSGRAISFAPGWKPPPLMTLRSDEYSAGAIRYIIERIGLDGESITVLIDSPSTNDCKSPEDNHLHLGWLEKHANVSHCSTALESRLKDSYAWVDRGSPRPPVPEPEAIHSMLSLQFYNLLSNM